MVKNDSPIRTNAQVDVAGNRVVVGKGSAYDLFLTRELKHAQIVRTPTSAGVVAEFLASGAEVAAGVKQQLEAGWRQSRRRPPGRRALHGNPASDGRPEKPRTRRRGFPGAICRGHESVRIRCCGT